MQYLHEFLEYEKQLPAKIIIHSSRGYYEMPEHWHRSLEITYMMSPASVTLNGKRMVLDDGDIVMINSGDIHRAIAVDRENVKAVTVMISYELLLGLLPDYDSYVFNLSRSPRKYKDLADVFRTIYCLYEENTDVYRYLKLNELLYRLLYLLFACFKEEKAVSGRIRSEKYFDRFKKIMEYMNELYREPLRQEEIAEHFGLSKEYLSRCFKKYTGSTCMEYLEHVRLNAAYQQLMKTDSSMMEIALDNGFADLRAFTNAFKKVYGRTPFQYKKYISDSKN